jgi:hypothetical protein
MSAFWLKLIGTSEGQCEVGYQRSYVDFARRPRQIRPGDRMILYACGG